MSYIKQIISTIFITLSLLSSAYAQCDFTLKHEPPELNCNYPFNLYVLESESCIEGFSCWNDYYNARITVVDGIKTYDTLDKKLEPYSYNYAWRIYCEEPSVHSITVDFISKDENCTKTIELDLSEDEKIEEYERYYHPEDFVEEEIITQEEVEKFISEEEIKEPIEKDDESEQGKPPQDIIIKRYDEPVIKDDVTEKKEEKPYKFLSLMFISLLILLVFFVVVFFVLYKKA